MARISQYPDIGSLAASDRLLVIDTSNDTATKTTSIEGIVNLVPDNTLQEVLDAGNTATQDINLTGQIVSTSLTTENAFILNDLNVDSDLTVDGFSTFNEAGFNGNVEFFNPVIFQDNVLVPEIQFENPATSGEKLLKWNDTDGTLDLGLKGGNVTLQIGQEQVIRVVNGTGADLLEAEYRAVKVIGAQGQRLQVGLAQANSDINSATTIGLVTETIANNQEGFITTEGTINKVNTTGSLQGETWDDGDVLYLSATIPGAITNVKPITPDHLIVVGFVEYAHANNGKIYVKVDNGYELDELHDVLITNPTGNQLLAYNAITGFWRNIGLGSIGGVTTASPGVSNYVTKFNSSSTISPSTLIFDNGTGVGIGTTTTNEIFNVEGKLALNNATSSISIGKVTGGTGIQCIAIGSNALSIGTGGNNIAVGFRAMRDSTTANVNVVIGVEAMQANTTGSENSVIGYRAMQTNTTGIRNVAIGREALKFNVGGDRNTAIGHQSLFNNNLDDNVAVGYQSLFSNTTGQYNSAFGNFALDSNTAGSSNTALGYAALSNNTIGSNNVAIGESALLSNTTGSNHVAIGAGALEVASGNKNVAIGAGALGNLLNVGFNTAIGSDAGKLSSSGNNTNSTNSVFIGVDTKAKNTNDVNTIVIGTSATGNGSNTTTIGAVSHTALYFGGNGAGLVLKSPDGTSYKITVDNSGNLVTTAI